MHFSNCVNFLLLLLEVDERDLVEIELKSIIILSLIEINTGPFLKNNFSPVPNTLIPYSSIFEFLIWIRQRSFLIVEALFIFLHLNCKSNRKMKKISSIELQTWNMSCHKMEHEAILLIIHTLLPFIFSFFQGYFS